MTTTIEATDVQVNDVIALQPNGTQYHVTELEKYDEVGDRGIFHVHYKVFGTSDHFGSFWLLPTHEVELVCHVKQDTEYVVQKKGLARSHWFRYKGFYDDLPAALEFLHHEKTRTPHKIRLVEITKVTIEKIVED